MRLVYLSLRNHLVVKYFLLFHYHQFPAFLLRSRCATLTRWRFSMIERFLWHAHVELFFMIWHLFVAWWALEMQTTSSAWNMELLRFFCNFSSKMFSAGFLSTAFAEIRWWQVNNSKWYIFLFFDIPVDLRIYSFIPLQ